jgi:hypothetical protein
MFLCEFPDRFASSRLNPGMGLLLCLRPLGRAANEGVDHGAASFFSNHLRALLNSVSRVNMLQASKSAESLRRAIEWWPYLLIAISVIGFLYRAAT